MQTRLACALQGCQRTIYLCDDGKDANKEAWVESLNRTGAAGCPVVYIRGHPRAPGEVNGKSGNLNNALSNVLYPGGMDPGSHEVTPGRSSIPVDTECLATAQFLLHNAQRRQRHGTPACWVRCFPLL